MSNGDRVERTQKAMVEQGWDLLLLSPGANMFYLSGFSEPVMERLLLYTLRPEERQEFLVPRLYEDHVRASCQDIDIYVMDDGEVPEEFLRRRLIRPHRKVQRVLLENSLEARWVLALRSIFPRAALGLASTLFSPQRLQKDADEVANLQRAAAIADVAFAEISRQRLIGRREREIAGMLEERMLAAGADSVAFPVQVASGPNSAFPHYPTGQRKVERGDMVVLDFGCRVNGYCSDMTRTLACGEVGAVQREVYETVRQAQERAVLKGAPGIAAHAVDAAAREAIGAAGYGDAFIHRTGHGVGLEVHEEPYIDPANLTLLRGGMVFTVEPGVYLTQRFGVRIEDTVLMTENGAQRLTRSPREMLVI